MLKTENHMVINLLVRSNFTGAVELGITYRNKLGTEFQVVLPITLAGATVSQTTGSQ